MAVTEAERHHLYETLKSSLGDRDAETFMNLMPPANWTEFAMKSDIAELRTEFAELRTELKGDIADLKSDIADRQSQMLRTFGTWLFVSQAGVIAAVTLVVALAT